jgi:hypothetical protein
MGMLFRFLNLVVIFLLGVASTPFKVCYADVPERAADSLLYQGRLIEQTSDEIRKALLMIDGDAESARMHEVVLRTSVPASALDVSKLKVEYTTDNGNVVPTAPGELKNLFVLRGKFRNNHQRFRTLIQIFRVSLKDCVGQVCESMAATVCRSQYVVPISSETEVDIPLLFATQLKLKGTLKAEVEVVENWSDIEPSVQAKEIADMRAQELAELEAEEQQSAKAEKATK